MNDKPHYQATRNTTRVVLLALLGVALLIFTFDRIAIYLYQPQKGNREVIIYTTQWCPYCSALRKTLQANNIPFTEHDVEQSIQGIIGYWALRARGVPTSVIGETIIYGYDGQQITDALVSSGYQITTEWPAE